MSRRPCPPPPTIERPRLGGNNRDEVLSLSPPYDFEKVVVRAFPLRADLDLLESFTNRMLNVVPPEVGRFRPFLPYVYLLVLNYGRMAVEAANLGWIAQHEICFSIPLEWRQLKGNEIVFRDWAFVSPFIWVDEPLSLVNGREVYGWPKAAARIVSSPSIWTSDPRGPETMATMQTSVFRQVYSGQRQQQEKFLEVRKAAPPSFTEWPFNTGAPFLPWVSLPRAITHSFDLGRDFVGVLTGLGLLPRLGTSERAGSFGAPPANLPGFMAMALQVLQGSLPYSPNLAWNTLNLKQFRDAEHPRCPAYQALTVAPMIVTDINRGGLLGDANVMMGDTSGGFDINFYSYPSLPIVDLLGLRVANRSRGDGVDVATLKPVFPFWLELDMRYNKAQTLTWRTRRSGWHRSEDPAGSPSLPPTPESCDNHGNALYNTTNGAAAQTFYGPFFSPRTVMRVLPLLARRDMLEEFCRLRFNDPLRGTGIRFTPWGRYVYLIATTYDGLTSTGNDIGDWGDREVSFMVPVVWKVAADPTSERDEDYDLYSLGLVPAFSYTNSTIAAISATEVTGIRTFQADITNPADPWMSREGPAVPDRQLLSVFTTVLPVLGQGQRGVSREVLEIHTRCGDWAEADENMERREINFRWGHQLRAELERRKQARGPLMEKEAQDKFDRVQALLLELVANRRPINVITLKEFPDASQPLRACFQALTVVERSIERLHDVREFEEPVTVRLRDYPTQRIVEDLGLEYVSRDVGPATGTGAGPEYTVQAVRPFWLRAAMNDALGKTICERTDMRWRLYPLGPSYFRREGIPR